MTTAEDSPWADPLPDGDPLPDETSREEERYVALMGRLRSIEEAVRAKRTGDAITIGDGVRIGIGMFIALPLMVILLLAVLSTLGLSIGGLFR
jgi:hypothetical protein